MPKLSAASRGRACAETSPARGLRRTTARTCCCTRADCTDPEARACAVELQPFAAEPEMRHRSERTGRCGNPE
jgi:hypothetical protein